MFRIIVAILLGIQYAVIAACGGGGGSGGGGVVTVGGTVSGLMGSGLVLAENGTTHLIVATNGAFTFATSIPAGSTYTVTVVGQPTNPTQTCTIADASGRADSDITTVSVGCTTTVYPVGGTLSGLVGLGSGLVLLDNASDALELPANGTFTFPTAVASGNEYFASVQAQPVYPPQYCTVTNGSGTVEAGPISNIDVACTTRFISLFAGNLGGPGSSDGVGAAATFNFPEGVAADTAGNVYVADTYNRTIRKITPAGIVTTFAGTAGVIGSADGVRSAATFSDPGGVAIDKAGNVYVADTGNSTIRKITPAGVVSTLAGKAGAGGSADGTGAAARFQGPYGVATDAAGNVYVADTYNATIRKITPAGVVSTLAGKPGAGGSADGTGAAARFQGPYGVATDAAGNVYVADTGNNTIRKVTPAAVVTTLAGGVGGGYADGLGRAARFNLPIGVATDATGHVYVADLQNCAVRKITSSGLVTTLAGNNGYGSADGAGAFAQFQNPHGVATDVAGNVLVADTENYTIRKITPGAFVTTLAGTPSIRGGDDGTGALATFYGPYGIAVDAASNIYVADSGNNTVRKLNLAGAVTTLGGVARVVGSADGVGTSARFNGPSGIATDSSGNVFVADSLNSTIRKVTPVGVVTTLAGTAGIVGSADGVGSAAQFAYPGGVATDTAGNVYVADTLNCMIRKVTPGGVVTTLAGSNNGTFEYSCHGHADGVGAAAQFWNPSGIATDATGNVYVADTYNGTIRKITPVGVVTTLAGTAGVKGSADGVGSAAQFSGPGLMAIDSSGNLYVADNDTIRKITPDGTVSTVIGVAGASTFTAGPLPAQVDAPVGLAISGRSVYVTLRNGIALALDVP